MMTRNGRLGLGVTVVFEACFDVFRNGMNFFF